MSTQTVSTSGSGLIFNNTYTANCSQQYISCIVAAEEALEGLWDNSLTVNVTFDEQANGTASNTLATNHWTSFINVSYSQLKNALPASDSLPSTDPTGGHTWSLPEAYARMLGLTSSAPSTDDIVTLNSSYNWSFGQDVISTVEHEITEGVMGRVGGLGDQNTVWSTMDLFRYSSRGVRDFADGRDGKTTYFSVNGSMLSSLPFNNEFSSNGTKTNTGDTADFSQNDVFGTGFTGEPTTLSQTDMAVMAALGWKQTVHVAPSPNDTVITVVGGTSTGAITDANGNSWAVAGGKVTANGVVDSTTANVIALAYVNGKVWQENTSDLWWGKTLPTDSWSPANGTPASPLPFSTSPNDTAIQVVGGTSTGAITDANGNKWAVAGGKVTVNGIVDSTTANVVELAYANGKVWQENASGLWWGKGKASPTDSWSPANGTPKSPLPASTSPNDTVVSVVGGTSTGTITDANGNSWAVAGGKVTVNGAVDSTTSNVIELAYVNGKVWQENASDLWWDKTSPADSWAPANGTPTCPLPYSTSPNDTIISVVSGTGSGAITDANGNKWAVAGGNVTVNGVVDSTTANVVELAYVNGKVWQENASALWWGKTLPTDSWAPASGTPTSPLPKGGSADPGTDASIAVIAPSDHSVTGNDISTHIAAGNSTPVFIAGNADSIILPAAIGNLAITDNGQGTSIVLASAMEAGATITIHDFQNDPTGLISLPIQYQTADAALATVQSDGQGGSILPFANGASLHFVGDERLTGANFKIAAST